jgi:H+/Cl- antiporter ClcA
MLIFAAVIGMVAALVTAAFFFVMTEGQHLLWTDLPNALGISEWQDSAILIVSLCLTGGLVIGLLTHFTKVKPVILQEELREFTENKRMVPKNGIVGMIRGLVALLFGGSIGPEGPLTGGTGGLGTWIAERMKLGKPGVAVATYSGFSGMFGAFLASPFASPLLTIESSLESQKPSTWKILIPGIVAATSAYALFYVLTGYVFGDLYDFPEYDGVQVIQLIYALFLGLLGGALGLLFINLYKVMKRVSEPLQSRPIPLALLTGLILGMVGVLLPLTLFDGQEQIQDLIDNAAELGIIMLIILALAKIFLTVTCLSMGWTGGYVFPSFFIGASAGLAVHLVFPFIPEVVCMVCVIAGIAVALLRSPIALSMIIAAMFEFDLTPVIAIAIVSSFILTLGASMLTVEKEKDVAGSVKT